MEENNGVGLSANQIGIDERVFVMYSDVKKKEVIVSILTLQSTQKKIIMDEGCLTWLYLVEGRAFRRYCV